MSFEAKIFVCAVVLAVVIPLAVMVLRRIIGGKPFAKPKMGSMSMPQSGPSIDL